MANRLDRLDEFTSTGTPSESIRRRSRKEVVILFHRRALEEFHFHNGLFPFSNGHFPMDRYGSFLAPFFDRNDGWISYINSTALNRPTEVAVDLIKRIWWPWSRATSSWDPTRTRSISLTVSFNPFKWVVVDISWLYFHPTLLYCAVVVFNINCYRQMDRLGHNLDLCQHQWNSCNV